MERLLRLVPLLLTLPEVRVLRMVGVGIQDGGELHKPSKKKTVSARRYLAEVRSVGSRCNEAM